MVQRYLLLADEIEGLLEDGKVARSALPKYPIVKRGRKHEIFDLKEHLTTPVTSSNFGLKEFWHLSEVAYSFAPDAPHTTRMHTYSEIS